MSREGSPGEAKVDARTANRRLALRIRIAVGWAVLIIFGGGGALYLYAHQAREVPPLLWTTADLAELPEEEGNGWSLLRGRRFPRGERGDVHTIEDLPTDLDEAGVRALADQVSRRQTLRDAVAAEPLFVDACAVMDLDCPELEALDLANDRALAMLDAAYRDDWSRVRGEADALQRQGAGLIASCRSATSCVVGARSLRLLMTAVERVAVVSNAASRLRVDDMTHVLRIVQDAPEPTPNISRVVAEDYVEDLAILALVDSHFLADAAITRRRMNEMYERTYEYAADPALPAPTMQYPTDQRFWWLYNAAGKPALSIIAISCETLISGIEVYREDLAALADARTRALGTLTTAIAEAEARDNQVPGPDTTDE